MTNTNDADDGRLQAALDLVRHKLRVLPLHGVIAATHAEGFICRCGSLACDNKGKHPLARLVPHGCLDATDDAERVRHWWTGAPSANVGIATGRGLFVLDVDPRHGGDETLEKLERENSPLPRTWRTRTGGGGEHLYFHTPAAVPNSVGKVGPGLDVRSAGGFVVGAGSQHVSGRFYAWEADPDTTELADAPAWLIERACRGGTKKTAPQPPAEWRALVAAGITEGARDCTIARLVGHLLARRIDPYVALELVQSWNTVRCTPPLPACDVERIVGSICGRELRKHQP